MIDLSQYEKITQYLWNGYLSIAYFLFGRMGYWVLDYRYKNYLNHEMDARLLLSKGKIYLEIYNTGLRVKKRRYC